MNEKITLNQIGVLRGIFNDKIYSEHLQNFNLSNLEEVMASLTEKQYRYILYLISVKRWITVKQILNQQGLINK